MFWLTFVGCLSNVNLFHKFPAVNWSPALVCYSGDRTPQENTSPPQGHDRTQSAIHLSPSCRAPPTGFTRWGFLLFLGWWEYQSLSVQGLCVGGVPLHPYRRRVMPEVNPEALWGTGCCPSTAGWGWKTRFYHGCCCFSTNCVGEWTCIFFLRDSPWE